MKTLWRLSNMPALVSPHGPANRWMPAGFPVVLLYDSAPAAVFACMANAEVPNPSALPSRYLLLEVAVPLHCLRVAELPPRWQSDSRITRKVGRLWFEQAESPVLQVCTPSGTVQYLFNTEHPQAQAVTVASQCEPPFTEHLAALQQGLTDGTDWLAVR